MIMKKGLSVLFVLFAYLTTVAQSSFPVEVTNQFNPVPNWAYATGQRNNAYTHQLVTRAQVEAAPPSAIGYLYNLSGAFGPGPGKALVINRFTVMSSKKVALQIRVGTPTGVLSVANIPEMDVDLVVGPEAPVYVDVNWILHNLRSVFITCNNFMVNGEDSAWITIVPQCYTITEDFNYNAKKRMLWVGTSITNGTGPTTTGAMYHVLFKDTLRKLGSSLRHELFGISGSNTAIHVPFFDQGYYDVLSDGKAPDVLAIELVVNDASSPPTQQVYQQRITKWAQRFLTNPENKKIIVLVLGGTPLENTTNWNNLITIDGWAESTVNTLKTLYPNRIFFVKLRDSFTRTDAANYASTDVPGQRIHPNDLGCQRIATVGFGTWLTTADGISFLNSIK